MPLKIQNNETVLFIGNSITDCGRRANARPLGEGYVKLFADLAAIREPAKRMVVINKGIGGDRVTGLRNRWHDDVLRNKPDWLSIKIGINDLHSALRNDPAGVPPALFAEAYGDILSKTRDALPRCRILLIDPFYISTERSKTSFRRDVLDLLPEYLAVVHRMSRQFRTRMVRTHDIFQGLLKHRDPDTWCPEPVHPNPLGHLVIAEAVYDALSR